jgi:hypothetical protein
MNRTSRARAVVVVVILFWVALSSATSHASRAVAAPEKVPIKQWLAPVCKSFDRWNTRLTELSSISALPDRVAAKTALAEFVGGALKATKRLVKDLKEAGEPRIRHGADVAAALRSAAKEVRKAYLGARESVATLSTDDAAVFAFQAHALAQELRVASTRASAVLIDATQRALDRTLDKAISTTKACENVI